MKLIAPVPLIVILMNLACNPSETHVTMTDSANSRSAGAAQIGESAKPAGPTIIVHRGLHHALPENSLEAMLAGWRAGHEWCECDVYLSADGVPFLMHDAKLDRTTEATGPVAARTWADLKQIRLKTADGTVTEYRIPSLEAVLAAMPQNRGLLIELKPADNEQLVRESLRLAAGRRHVIQSFDAANVRHALRLSSDIPCAFLGGKPEALETAMTGEWAEINLSHKIINEPIVRQAREQGKSLGTWTVNEPADIGRVLDLGVERIITDHPERVRAIIDERSGLRDRHLSR